MIDFVLHFIVSFVIYASIYIIFQLNKTAFFVTMGIGISKEIIDSITHYIELIDLIGDISGIILCVSLIKIYKKYNKEDIEMFKTYYR